MNIDEWSISVMSSWSTDSCEIPAKIRRNFDDILKEEQDEEDEEEEGETQTEKY